MAVLGVTAKLEYQTGETWTAITCRSVSFPAVTVGSVETTHLGISDYGRTFDAGMIDAGTISVESPYTEALYTTLNGFLRASKTWRVTGPSGQDAVVTFGGFITSLSVPFTTSDDEVLISFEIKASGVPSIS